MAHKLLSSSDEDPFDDDDLFNDSAEIAALDAALEKSKKERAEKAAARFKAPTVPKSVLKKREQNRPNPTPPAKKRKVIKSRPRPNPVGSQEIPIPVKELACTKKKADEVRSWIIGASTVGSAPSQKVLLVSGPNGCGKFTAVKSVCHEERIDIQEYVCAEGASTEEENIFDVSYNVFRDPSARDFMAFIYQRTLFRSESRKQLLIIKELPFSLAENPLEFEKIAKTLQKAHIPTVFITNTPRLYPNLLVTFRHVQFLKVSATAMKKVLGKYKNLSTKDIKEIVEAADGDVRQAINMVHFNSRKVSGTSKVTCAQGDSKLLLFRALGRILYSKRLDTREPSKFRNFSLDPIHQRRELQYPEPEAQCLNSGFQPSTFSQFLHENLPRCIPKENMEQYDNFIDDFSFADQFSKFMGYGYDHLKDYEAAVACRSLSYWNPDPIKPSGFGTGALHKPAAIQHRKQALENRAKLCSHRLVSFNGSVADIATDSLPGLAIIKPEALRPMFLDGMVRFPQVERQTKHFNKLHEGDEINADDEMEVTTHDERIKAAKEKEDREKYEFDVKIDDSDDWNF